ncbi:MAG: hypothetical protein AAB483_02545 [Patescibacteria group bacterium]
MVFILIADWIFQRFAPGMFWFAPMALIAAMIAQKKPGRDSLIFMATAIIIDLVSGIPFGWVTSAFVAIQGIVFIGARWVRTRDMHVLFFGVYAVCLTAIFAFMISYPLGMSSVAHRLPIFLLQSLAPLIMVIVINQPPRIKAYGTA